jgi:hypothetical protein
MAAVGLLITVIVCISVSFWMAFVDKEIKGWERVLLIGMFLGFCLFLCLSFLFYVDVAMEMPGWKQANPTIVNNELAKAEWMFILAIILLAAIPFFILIFRRESVVRWMKRARLSRISEVMETVFSKSWRLLS